jgi:hypothetical protein
MSCDPPLPALESDASSVHAVYFGVTNGGVDKVGQTPSAPEAASATPPRIAGVTWHSLSAWPTATQYD